MIKILVCDDQPSTSTAIQDALRAVPEFNLIGEAEGGERAISLAARLRPDIVLMGVVMSEMNGIDATRQIVARTRNVKVLAVSMNSEPIYVWAMIDAGASGYVVKSNAREELVGAIRVVAAGGTYLSACLGVAAPPVSAPAAPTP